MITSNSYYIETTTGIEISKEQRIEFYELDCYHRITNEWILENGVDKMYNELQKRADVIRQIGY